MKKLARKIVVVVLLAVNAIASAAEAEGQLYLPRAMANRPDAGTVTLMGAPQLPLTVEQGCIRTPFFTVVWDEGAELKRDALGPYLQLVNRVRRYRIGQVYRFGGQNFIQNPGKHYAEMAARCPPPYVYTTIVE